jgi:hypothetical protein
MLLLPLKSCVDPVPFTAEGPERVVIFGSLTQEARPHVVDITRTGTVGALPDTIRGAAVDVVDETGARVAYQQNEEGRYELRPDYLSSLGGSSYHLEGTLPDGETYQSTPQSFLEPVEMQELDLQFRYKEEESQTGSIREVPVIELFVSTPLIVDGQQSYLRWEVEEAWSFQDIICGGIEDLNATVCHFSAFTPTVSVPIFHSTDNSQTELSNFKVFERSPYPTIQFNFQHYFTVRQFTLDQEAYEYWQKINEVSNPQGTIFDVIPAGVQGNLYNIDDPDELVLGYFEVASSTLKRTYTLPETLDGFFFVSECDRRLPLFGERLTNCCYCFTIDAPLIQRPDYWGP